jgi:hypothetical protein
MEPSHEMNPNPKSPKKGNWGVGGLEDWVIHSLTPQIWVIAVDLAQNKPGLL